MAQVAARIPAMITAGAKGIVIQGGLNDAVTNGSAVSVFAASATTAIGYCTAAGIPCVMMTTTPTYAGTTAGVNTAPVQALIYQYVQWVQNNAPGLGATVADAYTAVVGTPGSTGQMQSQYSNTASGGQGDSEHPGPLGHWKIGTVVAAAQLASMASMTQVVNWASLTNIHPNSLNAGGGTVPTGATFANYAGAVPTNSLVADGSGFLPAGVWAQADIVSNASASVNELLWTVNSANYSTGDVLAFGGYAQYQDITSTYLSDLFNGLATYNEFLLKQNLAGQVVEVLVNPNQGPSLQLYTVPSGTTSIQFCHQTRLKATGGEIQYRMGDMYVYNLTRLGLAGQIT
jgi:hypothetical protein